MPGAGAPAEMGNHGVCMCERREADLRVVQRGENQRTANWEPQLSVGKLLLIAAIDVEAVRSKIAQRDANRRQSAEWCA